jgi:phage tail tape-measure protein
MRHLRDETPVELIALARSGNLGSYLLETVKQVQRMSGEIEGTPNPTAERTYLDPEAEAEALMAILPETEIEASEAEAREAERIYGLVMSKLESAAA